MRTDPNIALRDRKTILACRCGHKIDLAPGESLVVGRANPSATNVEKRQCDACKHQYEVTIGR